MSLTKIKTLLIDDSGFMRIFLSDLLRADNRIEVLDTAINGLEGVQKAKALKPDVIITDMVMPHYDGLFVVKQLMKEMPVPIILLSSLDRTDPKIFDALNEGAFDFIDKPLEKDVRNGFRPLTNLVCEASASPITKSSQRTRRINSLRHTFDPILNYEIITIGASTGGPGAVEFVINNIPENLSTPVIIAQHMPERFINSFVKRLCETTKRNICVAHEGKAILNHTIYLLPGNTNTRIDHHRFFRFTQDTYVQYNNPSVDCLFESIASVYGKKAIGIILTGMGKDGVKGLAEIKAAGGLTISQDQASSVVYGMPKAAAETGAASHQLPLTEIPTFIISAL